MGAEVEKVLNVYLDFCQIVASPKMGQNTLWEVKGEEVFLWTWTKKTIQLVFVLLLKRKIIVRDLL